MSSQHPDPAIEAITPEPVAVEFVYASSNQMRRALGRMRTYEEVEKDGALDVRVRQLYERQHERKAAKSGTPEWQEDRRKRLTASNLAAVLGKNPYESPVRCYRILTGQVTKVVSQFMVSHGNRYEFEAACVYSQLTGLDVIATNTGVVEHPRYDWLGATPDFVTFDGILVEIKSPRTRKITHDVLRYYYPQLQLQLHCCELDVLHYVQYKPATAMAPGEVDIIVVHRSDDWFKEMLPFARSFWSLVKDFSPRMSRAEKMARETDVKEIGRGAQHGVSDWKSDGEVALVRPLLVRTENTEGLPGHRWVFNKSELGPESELRKSAYKYVVCSDIAFIGS